MKWLKGIVPVVLLVALAGCFSEPHHRSHVKIMTKSHDVTHVKVMNAPPAHGNPHKGKAKGWE